MRRYRVGQGRDVPEGGRKRVVAGGLDVFLFRHQGRLYAYRNVCPHAGAPVCEGRIVSTTAPARTYEYRLRSEPVLRCPWHGWEFDLRTGEHLVSTGKRLKSYPVEETDGDVYLVLSGRPRDATGGAGEPG